MLLQEQSPQTCMADWLTVKQTAGKHMPPERCQVPLQIGSSVQGGSLYTKEPDLLASCCCCDVVAVGVQVEGPAGAVREGSPS